MRKLVTVTLIAIVCSMGVASAELQNVAISGDLHIRGNYFDMDGSSNEALNGMTVAYGGYNNQSMMGTFGWLESTSDDKSTFITQRTVLGVTADFTDEVTAYIEFDNYSIWGEDFRSMDWESGYDDRATIDDNNAEVEIYQAFIEARNMWGMPVNLKIGRQELIFGNEWLLGNNDDSYAYYGLSYDAIRLDYDTDMVMLSLVAAKLEENVWGDLFENDENLYLAYGSYTGLEDIVIDGYVIYLDDDSADADILTVGLRTAGVVGPVDFEAEVAYQDQDTMVDDEFFAANLEIGYTLDLIWSPRLYIGGAYFEGNTDVDDNGNAILSDDEIMVSGFNRLFSDVHYSNFGLDVSGNLTNVIIGRLGIDLQPTESIATNLEAAYFLLDEEIEVVEMTATGLRNADWDDTLGVEIAMKNTYQYSEDLAFVLRNAFFISDNDDFDGDFMYHSLAAKISF